MVNEERMGEVVVTGAKAITPEEYGNTLWCKKNGNYYAAGNWQEMHERLESYRENIDWRRTRKNTAWPKSDAECDLEAQAILRSMFGKKGSDTLEIPEGWLVETRESGFGDGGFTKNNCIKWIRGYRTLTWRFADEEGCIRRFGIISFIEPLSVQ